jgi:hypothetical protein
VVRCRRHIPEQQTHDYIRNGTTSLCAALEVATGKVTADACYPRHTHVEFLAFLKLVAKSHPRIRLCVVCDNYATHKHPNVQAWLDKNPRITLHFTPASCSWLNLVDIFFGIITRQAIRRGTFTDVTELQTAIRTYIDSYNDRATPFAWTPWMDWSGGAGVRNAATKMVVPGALIAIPAMGMTVQLNATPDFVGSSRTPAPLDNPNPGAPQCPTDRGPARR